MTNKKSTKRALLLSALSLLMCVSMLIGSTFAWFTDSVTNGINKIQSGNLDVELYHMNFTEAAKASPVSNAFGIPKDATGEKVGPDTKLFLNEEGKEMLWEPGATNVESFRIKNEGSLALKYQFKFEFANATKTPEGKTLADVINISAEEIVYDESTGYPKGVRDGIATLDDRKLGDGHVFEGYLLPGEEYNFWIALQWLPSDIDNAFNVKGGLSIDLGVTLLATQYTYEKDNYYDGDKYDQGAKYPAIEGLFPVKNDLYLDKNDSSYVAVSTAGLSSMAEYASNNDSITSVTYVTDEGEVEVPVVSDNAAFESAIDSQNEFVILTDGHYQMPDGSELTNLVGKELVVVGTEDTVVDVSNVDARDQFVTGATIVFDGVTLNFDDGRNIYMGFANTKNLIYRNCHITGMQMLFGENVTFENCVLDSSANVGEPHAVWTYGAKNITFTDCEFIYGDRAINCYKDQDIDGGKQVVNFKNCTFKTTAANSEGAVEINSSAFSVGIEVNMEGCTAPANGPMAYVSPWDSTNGAKTTINIH